MINLKTREEALELVYNILNQGDSRYNAPEEEEILADFLIKQAVSIEESSFSEVKEPNEKEISKHFVQGKEKQIAAALLKAKGFDDAEIFFEKRFIGSVPDILAEKEDLIVVVECCSCRVNKIIDYLLKTNEVWVLTRGENPWEEKPLFEKMQWFIFKKGANWNNVYNNFQKQRMEEIKRIKSPIDSW